MRSGRRTATPLRWRLAEGIEAWLADVRYRGEQEQALNDVKRSLVRLVHRASPQPVRPGDARRRDALAGPCPGEYSHGFTGASSASSGRAWRLACRGEADGAHPFARRRHPRRRVQPRRPAARESEPIDWPCSGTSPRRAALAADSSRQAIRAIAFSPDGAIFATACDDGSVMQVGWRNRGRRWPRHSARRPGHGPAIQPRRSIIATASRAGFACLWDMRTGQPIARFGRARRRGFRRIVSSRRQPARRLRATMAACGYGRPRRGACLSRRFGTRRL